MSAWKCDKAWSDRYMPTIKSVLGQVFIEEAPEIEDQQHNTDLVVFSTGSARIACRLRRHQYLERYGEQFTIRMSRPSGAETELGKIMDGWGDFFFYGFASCGGVGLSAWKIADLGVFRDWRTLHPRKHMAKPNRDGSSEFFGFAWNWLPHEFVIAEGGPIEIPKFSKRSCRPRVH